ncbi:Na/Pi cotransporter family protein [Haliea sp. E17]|uniref:Na/Pi cotransporter family protein n=1 Tax=Haliea sp. E17 TaxID=3401576 RepID=UPI003AAB5FE7
MVSELAGGLGLLLIGMSLMTDGLKLAAGSALRDLLATWTSSRLRGLAAGFLITAVVQSSSAVTVATIGFANAGMLSLERAIWVIFGSNVGTTMTAWIVAVVGFKLDIQAYALPLVGIGALLKLTGARSRRGSYGLALVGFGLLFLGIGVLKAAFDGLGSDYSLPSFERLNLVAILAYVAIGFVLTALMQSSSAAMVVALSAAQSGLVELNAAAAVVIGANLGTTSTALLTIFGATPNARRVAVAHLAFNLLTALVAILVLGPMLWLVAWMQSVLELSAAPAMTLALFHTVFNILGVLLMWPLSGRLVAILSQMFHVPEREAARPQYLDRASLSVPYTAVGSMTLEVQRVAQMSIATLQQSLQPGEIHPWREGRDDIRALAGAVTEFATSLNREPLTPLLAESVTGLMESLHQYLLVANLNEEIEQLESEGELWQKPFPAMAAFRGDVEEFLAGWSKRLTADEGENPAYPLVEQSYRTLKMDLLRQAGTGALDVHALEIYLQYMNEVKRACRQLGKANTRLLEIRAALAQPAQSAIEAEAAGEQVNGDEPASGETAADAGDPVDASAEGGEEGAEAAQVVEGMSGNGETPRPL